MNSFLANGSIFQAYTQADFFGKVIYLSLLGLSMISWYVMVSKIKLTRKAKFNSLDFKTLLEKKAQNLLGAEIDLSFEGINPYFQVYSVLKQKALDILNKNKFFAEKNQEDEVYMSVSDVELVQSQINATIMHQSKTLQKNLFILSTVITLAPFLGLLGTVWGILLTFSSLQAGGLSSANNEVLTGLSMALGTTVFGLVVAIPALVGHNYLKNFIKDFSLDMEHFSQNLVTSLEIQYRRV